MEDSSKPSIVAYTTPNFGPEKLYKKDSNDFKTMNDVFYYIPKFYYKFGDFIICPYYDKEEGKSGQNIYCISKNDKVVKIPNEGEYKNWTIPYDITKYLRNALLKFKDFPWIKNMYIRHDDKFVRKNLNTKKYKILKKWNWEIMLSLDKNQITINFDNKTAKTFIINKKLKINKLLQWYESSKLEQSKIDIDINVPLDKKKDFFKKLYFFKRNLHFTWNLQEIKVSSKKGFITKNYVLNGPKINKEKITKSINYRFNNFDINLNFNS